MAVVISIVAIAISLVSFFINLQASKSAERRGRMPVLVVTRLDNDEAGLAHILLSNVGSGPALNIIFGLAEEAEEVGSQQLHKGVSERWYSPLHLFPIPPGGKLDVSHPQSSNVLGATYTDALGHPYTVKTSQYGTRVLEGRHFPAAWTMNNVPAMWSPLPTDRPWSRTAPDGRTLG